MSRGMTWFLFVLFFAIAIVTMKYSTGMLLDGFILLESGYHVFEEKSLNTLFVEELFIMFGISDDGIIGVLCTIVGFPAAATAGYFILDATTKDRKRHQPVG